MLQSGKLPYFWPYILASERTVKPIELIFSPLVLEFHGPYIEIIRKQFGALWNFDFYCKIGILKTQKDPGRSAPIKKLILQIVFRIEKYIEKYVRQNKNVKSWILTIGSPNPI